MANFTEITTKTTTQIKTGAGIWHGILVSSPGTTWTIQVYDSNDITNFATTGKPIFGATAVTVPAAGTMISVSSAGIHFTQGLLIVTAGTTAGELTVIWV